MGSMEVPITHILSDDLNFTDYGYYGNDTYIPYVPDPGTFSCKMEVLDPTLGYVLCFFLVAIFCLAIPGNLLVGWVISTCRQALTPSDIYLVHLTVADGLMALTIPFLAVALVHGWIFGNVMCKLIRLIVEANFYTSILFLACISVDRYMVIVRANESLGQRQRMCSWFLCAAVWALGGALALPALFYDAEVLDPDSQTMICSSSFDGGSSNLWRVATRFVLHVFGFLVPLLVMLACYGITVARLLRTRGFQKHRAMKVIVAVVVAFLLCWMPYHGAVIADTFLRAKLVPFICSTRRSLTNLLRITHCLVLVHSCINPILYAFIGEKFRRNMARLLQRRARQERASGSGSKFSRSTSQTSENNGTVL